MDGVKFARIIEQLLAERGIKKSDFYSATGISATAMYGWKRGAEPKRDTVETVEKYFDVSFNDYEKEDNLENLREDLRTLLRSAKDLPPSSVYQFVAMMEKEKEDAN